MPSISLEGDLLPRHARFVYIQADMVLSRLTNMLIVAKQ